MDFDVVQGTPISESRTLNPRVGVSYGAEAIAYERSVSSRAITTIDAERDFINGDNESPTAEVSSSFVIVPTPELLALPEPSRQAASVALIRMRSTALLLPSASASENDGVITGPTESYFRGPSASASALISNTLGDPLFEVSLSDGHRGNPPGTPYTSPPAPVITTSNGFSGSSFAKAVVPPNATPSISTSYLVYVQLDPVQLNILLESESDQNSALQSGTYLAHTNHVARSQTLFTTVTVGDSATIFDGIPTGEPLPVPSVGDFNFDGFVDSADIDLLNLEIRTTSGFVGVGSNGLPGSSFLFDLNLDDMVDSADATVFVEVIKNTVFGDTNFDGRVDNVDLGKLLNNWGAFDVGWENASMDSVDNQVNQADQNYILNNWGFGTGSSVAVPEPSAAACVLMVCAYVCHRRDRR
ncbi:MAG: hypothetical protein AAFV43_12785 [Planctomycetota bacterium]